MKKYDIIIVGGGLGGLTAGAKLAKAGKSVLLIEQHDRVGGCATTFMRKGFTLEVGLHEMDGLHPGDMKSKIFRDLGILEKVDFIKVPEFYHFTNGQHSVTISHDPADVKERLSALFPEDRPGIEAYFDLILNIRQLIRNNELDPDSTIGTFLDDKIRNEELKLMLLGNLGYFHDDPYTLALSYYAMAQNAYYTGGGSFIRGGSQQLSDALADVIRNNGGEVLVDHLVTRILIEDERAIGVHFESNHTRIQQTAHASDIVANASIPQVVEYLLPMNYGSYSTTYSRLRAGASLLTVYFGFRKPLATLGHHHYSTFVFDPEVDHQRKILTNNRGSYEKRSFTFVDYSQIDAGLAPAGKAVGAICCMDYTRDWDGLNRDEYRLKKNEVEKIFRKRLNDLIPGIEHLIEYCEVGTAKTIKRYTLNPEGAVYGFAQSPERLRTNIPSPVENLHFASAWSPTGGGFSGAIFSGYLAAMDVIRKRR